MRLPLAAPRVGRVLAAAAILAAATAVLPPVGSESRRLLWVEGLQFVLLAAVVPALTALSLPAGWRPLHRGRGWLTSVAVLEVAVIVAWRVPSAVDGIAGHPWLVLVEGACLLAAGTALWSTLLAGAPLSEGSPPYPSRMAIAAVVMWSVWVLAYLVGFSHATWYRAYTGSSGLSVRADQQLTTGVLWAGAALAFIPVIFWCLWEWLSPEKATPA